MSMTAAKLMTAEQFYEWCQRPENRGRSVELERGEIIDVPPPGKYHGFVCANMAGILRDYAIKKQSGYVCTNDAGVIVARDPDTVRGPDVTFYLDSQTALDMDRRFAEQPPVLAVEVMSPSDRINQMAVRVSDLLGRGVPMVWVVDPEAGDVAVHRPGADPQLLEGADELTGGDLLEGFRCPVGELFAVPGKPTQAE